MNSERDIESISTWERRSERDPTEEQRPEPYVCVDCAWTGRGAVRAFAHHRVTGHAVRGKHWNPSWGNAIFGGTK